jgi:RNA ligase
MKQSHPTLPLSIYNYTQATQYESKWDEVTLMCRGLVLDDAGNIIARPFGKFFNYEEVYNQVPTKGDYVYVQEKMDGSMGILFYYEGEWIMATRGSFTSDQAVKGMEIAKRLFNLDAFEKSITYLCEIIYPENRIVVNYENDERMVLLGCIDCSLDGIEVNVHIPYYMNNFDVVKKYNFDDYSTLKGMISNNAEGFIVRFSNGDRMKIKGEEYLRLHRIMTNISTTAIWEVLSTGGSMDEILKDVPDEFFDKVDEVVKDLCIRFENIKRDYMLYFMDITNRIVSTDRKAFAEEAKRYNHPSLLFGILDGKDISEGVWRIVKPKFKKL